MIASPALDATEEWQSDLRPLVVCKNSPAIRRDCRGFQFKLLHTEKLAALGQLITGVAHELNNPLTSILGYSQRLLQKEHAAGSDREMRHIFEEAERATAILRQLLWNAHETKMEMRTVAINQVVLRAV